MTNSIGEFEDAELFLVTGSNTTAQHPLIGSRIVNAVERGAKLLLIDPRAVPLAPLASLHLRQNIGTDVAVLNGMMNVIIEEGLFDRGFVEERTEGFDQLKAFVARYTPAVVEKISGIDRGDLARAARTYAAADKAMIVYAMGITQHATRHRQRQILRESRHAHRPRGQTLDRGQPFTGAEQRPGGLRHGRPAECLFRLPARGRRRGAQEVRRGLGRFRTRRQARPHDRGDDDGGPQTGGRRPLRHGGKPDAFRSPQRARRPGALQPRIFGGSGHLPDRNRRQGGRGATGRLLCRAGRHLHQYGKAGPTRAKGRLPPWPSPAGLEGHLRGEPPFRLPP